jgi:2,3-bisphosphoglycerate-dependent phosphoglycerate mutase
MSEPRRFASRRHFVAAFLSVATLFVSPAPAAETVVDRPIQFWFIRHGESEINVDSIEHPVPDDGVSYPLTRTGVQQALTLGESLATIPIATIYTSTRLRAIQTADAVAFRHGLNISLAPAAVEIDLGMPIDAPDGSRAYRELIRKWVVDKDPNAKISDGESLVDVQRRFLPFVRELMNRHGDDTGIVVVVSHSATLGLLLPTLAPNVPADYMLSHPLPNTGIIKTELRDGRLFCTEWGGAPVAVAGH